MEYHYNPALFFRFPFINLDTGTCATSGDAVEVPSVGSKIRANVPGVSQKIY